MVLSETQKAEVHQAMLDYLHTAGLSASASAFAGEIGLTVDDLTDRAKGLLEKKWTSVVRLQKRVLALEAELKEAQAQMAAPVDFGRAKDSASWIPRPPHVHELAGHRLPVTCVRFHPVFAACATASEDASIKVWDTESGDLERTLKGHTAAVNDLCFDEKGMHLASCAADMTVRLWDFNAFTCVKTLRGHEHNVSSVQFINGGTSLLTASRDKTMRVWELATGYCLATLTGHTDWVRQARASISDGGSVIASVSNDQSVRVWSTKARSVTHVLRDHEHVVETVAFAPLAATEAINALMGAAPGVKVSDGPFFATGSRDRTIKLWDASTGQMLHTFIGHDNWVRDLVWHPGGRYLMSCGDDKTVRVWDLRERRCLKTLNAHKHFVNCIDMQSKSRQLASGSVDNTTHLWACR